MMTIPINREQAHALAALIAALRDDWDTAGVLKALSDARDRSTAWDLAHAALHAAQNPKIKTPAVIAMAGEHWTVGKALGESTTDAPRCPEPGHTSYFAHNCGYCKAERLETVRLNQGDRTPAVPPERINQSLGRNQP